MATHFLSRFAADGFAAAAGEGRVAGHRERREWQSEGLEKDLEQHHARH